MDLISVLMPVFNVEPFVAQAVESILNQSYKNFEFIIVDDCSSDATLSICRHYAENDSRIKLFRNESNLGIAKTLNFALSNAGGKYVVRMDGDDVSVPDRLERMKQYLDEHKEISLVGTSTITIDSDGNEVGRTPFPSDWDLILKNSCLRTPVAHIWMTYKSVYDALGGYRLVAPTEDYDFVLRCITSGYKVSNISDFYAYKVRVNRAGNSTNTYGIKKLKSHSYTVKNYKERLKKGSDNFSVEAYQKYLQASKLQERLYSFSNKALYKAISCRSKKNYAGTIFFTLISLISPYQIQYLWRTARYKFLTREKK